MSDYTAANDLANKDKSVSSNKIRAVVLLFLLSGLSSLIYQVIWTRQMVFVFGSSTFASATVISAFMGGLAIGSFVAGKYADKVRNPFLCYGILEGIIGVWAIMAPFMFEAALPIYKMFWQQFHFSVLPFSILRFCVVSLILLPPTACMGATLPLLSKFVTSSLSVVGNRVGTLYSINTLGAVSGALISGFYLIPSHGLFVSTMLAAATNILLAVLVFLLNKELNTESAIEPEINTQAAAEEKAESETKNESGSDAETSKQEISISKQALCTIIAFGVSGAIAMIYEVAWTRALLLVIGSTTYAFSIMLSTFLIGIFIGSFICAKYVDRFKNPYFSFSVLQVLLGLAGLASICMFNFLPYWNIVANYNFIHDIAIGMSVRFLLAGFVLLPITLALGATFPLAVKICTRELDRIGKSVGTLYSINTLGAIIGSFAAGFIIIPAIGGEQALLCAAAANSIMGAALLVIACPGQMAAKAISAIAAVALLIWTCQQPKIWDLHLITSSQKVRRGLNWSHGTVQPFDEWVKIVDNSFEILSWKDGTCANVAVVKFPDQRHSLFTNGHIDASDSGSDMPTQVLLPSIPLLLKPDAKSVADVGWGSGCTMGYALLFPIKNMVCAEIEPEVIATSKYFHSVNLAPEKDPRLRIEINDGRNYLLATNEKFDVITSEPSNPWQAGVCNLYTQEYFKVCHDRLNQGGIFTMWWQSNEVSASNLCRVFAALKKVFKHIAVFQTFTGDIAVCASDEQILIDLKKVSKALEDPRISESMAKYGSISTAEDLPIKLSMADEAVERLVKNVSPNTDDKNFIEFDVSKTYEQKNFSLENYKWFSANAGKLWQHIDWGTQSPQEKAQKMAEIAECAMMRNNSVATVWADQSVKEYPNPYGYCVSAMILAKKKGDFDKAFELADSSVKRFGDQRSICTRGVIELMAGAPMKARKDFEEALKKEPESLVFKYRLAQTYMPAFKDWYQLAILPMKDDGQADSDPQKALALLQPTLGDQTFIRQNPTVLCTAGAALYQLNDLDNAIRMLQNYAQYRPDDILATKLLGALFANKGISTSAMFCNQRAAQLSIDKAGKLCQSAKTLIANQKIDYAIGSLKQAIILYPPCADARVLLKQLALKSPEAELIMQQLAQSNAADQRAYEELKQEKANLNKSPSH